MIVLLSVELVVVKLTNDVYTESVTNYVIATFRLEWDSEPLFAILTMHVHYVSRSVFFFSSAHVQNANLYSSYLHCNPTVFSSITWLATDLQSNDLLFLVALCALELFSIRAISYVTQSLLALSWIHAALTEADDVTHRWRLLKGYVEAMIKIEWTLW